MLEFIKYYIVFEVAVALFISYCYLIKVFIFEPSYAAALEEAKGRKNDSNIGSYFSVAIKTITSSTKSFFKFHLILSVIGVVASCVWIFLWPIAVIIIIALLLGIFLLLLGW